MGNRNSSTTGPTEPIRSSSGRMSGGGPFSVDSSAHAAAPVRVMCPRCRAVLIPPAQLFRCPCGQMMTYDMQRAPAMPTHSHSISAPPAGSTSGSLQMHSASFSFTGSPAVPSSQSSAGAGPGGHPVVMRAGQRDMLSNNLEERMRFLIAHLPPDSPHAILFRMLLERLPRLPDGTINFAELEALSTSLAGPGGAMLSAGAPIGMIELLPTRRFAKDSLPAPELRQTEHTQCLVCLSDYEEGDELRTLPCLHGFHKGCIDEWLGRNRSCPLCKTSIDIDVDAMLAQQLEKEEQAAAKKTAAAAAAATASGSGTPAGGSGAPGVPSSGSGAETAVQRGGFMSRLRRNSNPNNAT